MRGGGEPAERSDWSCNNRFDTAHPTVGICLRIRAKCQPVVDTAPIEAAEGEVVAIHGTAPTQWCEHAGIKPEFAKTFGKLRLIEENVEIDGFAAPGIIGYGQLDVIGPLGKREIGQVERARIEFQPPNELSVNPHFHL